MITSQDRRNRRGWWLYVTPVVFVAIAFMCLSPGDTEPRALAQDPKPKSRDAAASRAAFLEVYKVLMHPRCMNCHPKDDAPLQGDDSHVHQQNVQRGEDGKGLYALKCSNCHQEKNTPGLNMPPGGKNWHLPEKKMPLVFEGKSPRELAEQLKDPKRNGGKTMEQMIEHAETEPLVLWGWNPGDGRTKPPISHDEFVKQVKLWIENGAEVPD